MPSLDGFSTEVQNQGVGLTQKVVEKKLEAFERREQFGQADRKGHYHRRSSKRGEEGENLLRCEAI